MKKRIIVLGGGFGGLRAAIQIGRKLRAFSLLREYEVLLIDRNDHHTYTPLLYEVATTAKDAANFLRLHEIATVDLATIASYYPVMFRKAGVEAIDVVNGDVHLAGGEHIKWESLVIALGSETNYFDIPGLKKHALPLKTFTDAVRIRERFINLVSDGKKEIRILIGGAGSSGVELAGELSLWAKEFARISPRTHLSIALIEAAETILPGFAPSVVRVAEKRLQKLGVQIITDTVVETVKEGVVILKKGAELQFDALLWTGGVKASSLLSRAPLQMENRGRVMVRGEMECVPQVPDLKLSSKIYAIGDVVCYADPATKKPIPGVARAAISQADIAAHNVIEDVLSERDPARRGARRSYLPVEYPYVIPIGGKYAIAKIGPIVLSGFFAWVLKGLVELNYLVSILPLTLSLKIWLKGLRIFSQNDRLG